MPHLLVWLLGLVVGGALCVGWIVLVARRPPLAVAGVVALACFSSHVWAAAYQFGVRADMVRGLIGVKDLAAALLLVVLGVRELRTATKVRRVLLPVLLLLGLVAIIGVAQWARHSGASAGDAALSARNAALPFVAVLTALFLTEPERSAALRASLYVVTTAALAALLEYLLPSSFVRDVLGVGAYWADVKQQSFHLGAHTGLPGNFFTSSGHRRLSGPFGDPLSAGYVLAIGVVLAVLSQGVRFRPLMISVMAGALLLTFTRAGWLLAALALLPLAVRAVIAQSWRGRAVLLSLGAALLGLLMLLPAYRDYFVGIISGRDDSTRGHLDALSRTTSYEYSVLGDGWGAIGGPVGRGTESVLVTLGLQVGLFGLVAYALSLVLVAPPVFRLWGRHGLGSCYVGLIAAVAVTAVISEQLLTFNAGYALILLLSLGPLRTATWTPWVPRRGVDVLGRDSAPEKV